MLTNVTLTGADDSIDTDELVALSVEFPFAEFGILIGSRGGVNRFPSGEWLNRLMEAVTDAHPHAVPLALHVCGKLVRSILENGSFPVGAAVQIGEFRRVQLNFAGESIAGRYGDLGGVVLNICGFVAAQGVLELIVKLDGVNDWILDALLERGIKASGLYDRSHGAGVSPDQWPAPNPAWSVGYAGGIGPENIAGELEKILAVAGERDVWIDMESRLFSGATFDLGRCRSVLEYCGRFIR